MHTAPPSSSRSARLRLWQAFVGGRALVAWVLLGLLLLQAWSLPAPGKVSAWAWLVTGGYLLATHLAWLLGRHRPLPPSLHPGWLMVLGADIATIFCLQALQVHPMHYTPLLALPILMAATLGRLLLAMGTTAVVSLLLLAWSLWNGWQTDPGSPEHYTQAALTGAAYFVLAYLAYTLARRLAREEQRAHHHAQHAQTQAEVNGLIVQHLSEGVLVLDAHYQVHMANPAARQLLSGSALASLTEDPAWAPLCALVDLSFAQQQAHSTEVNLLTPGQSPMGLYVRTWLTSADVPPTTAANALPSSTDPAVAQAPASLCVMFLDDLREAQARLRTEKLAAMGRMSAAVAHEIRNPLAAIVQANALLAEDLQLPHQQRLSEIVQQNADRLARIAEEILDIARAQNQIQHTRATALELDTQAQTLWHEWCQQAPAQRSGSLLTCSQNAPVEFEAEHLRRVVVNLLDNALRYISTAPDALQLVTGQQTGQAAWLQVWSDGAPLDASVERHLFEPFFSSHSRSSGLGLYLCRELCQRYGATLHYQRVRRPSERGLVEGNAFTIVFRHDGQPTASASRHAPIVV